MLKILENTLTMSWFNLKLSTFEKLLELEFIFYTYMFENKYPW